MELIRQVWWMQKETMPSFVNYMLCNILSLSLVCHFLFVQEKMMQFI